MKRVFWLLGIVICLVGFPLTLYMIFYKAGLQDKLFFSQKIFYYHVPCAIAVFVAAILGGISSGLFLAKRKGEYDDLAKACGEVAVFFGLIMLITGSLWGKVAWGKWWDWDARLTTALILWMTMLGYVMVREFGGLGSERLAAGLSLFGAVNVPLVYFSVSIWRTLHPSSRVVPGLEGNMKSAFWLSMLVILSFFGLLLALRTKAVRNERLFHLANENALDAGLIGTGPAAGNGA